MGPFGLEIGFQVLKANIHSLADAYTYKSVLRLNSVRYTRKPTKLLMFPNICFHTDTIISVLPQER